MRQTQTPKCFGGASIAKKVPEVLYHNAEFGGPWTLSTARTTKNVEF